MKRMKKMTGIKNKSKIFTIAIILVLTFSTILVALPSASAHDPPINIHSWPFLVASPNPVGVNQQVIIVMWIDKPLPQADVSNDIRRHNYTLTITAPNNDHEVMEWDEVFDTTSIQYTLYQPTQVGTYTLLFEYAGQVYTWNETGAQREWTNDTFSAASKEITLTVQSEQLPNPTLSYPLPEEYWTRPIEGQNTDWWKISSNWLSGPYTQNNVAADGVGPNTPHVMWTKPVQDGGVVGGNITTSLNGDTYYSGMAYNTRANNPIIMHGRLYYELPFGNSGQGGGWICVDLRTGEEIWSDSVMGTGSFFNPAPEPTFGYLYDLEYENQHGTVGSGWLISQSGFFSQTWNFIDPRTGSVIDGYSVTNVPSTNPLFGQISGPSEVIGLHGESIRYQIDLENGWLAQWNSSNLVWRAAGTTSPGQSGILDGSAASAYDWNITNTDLTQIPTGSTFRATVLNDMILMSNLAPRYVAGAFTFWATIDPYTVAAINLDPDRAPIGDLLWIQNYTVENDLLREYAPYGGGVDPVNRVFVMKDVEARTFTGYSMDNGSKVWGPTPPQPDFDYFNLQSQIAYGRFYSAGYGGFIFCYSMKNGSLLWTYGNGGEGNSTFAGLETAWGNYPQFEMAIAGGKIFVSTYEHSPTSPHYKDMRIRAVNAITGEEVWTLMGAGSAFEYGTKAFAVASGYAAWLNAYDMQMYVVGRGPSATTISIQNDVITHGHSVLIKGTVIDTASGTKQPEQIARFPNGVPAVSDESMSEWMEYVYMQKPRPTDTVGVDVHLTIIDPNSNTHELTATSDSLGIYSLMWEPPVPGKYTVIARFEGTEGYWPSSAETVFGVEEAPSPGGPIEPEPSVTPSPTPSPSPSESPTPTPSPSPSVTPGAPFPTEIAIAAVVVVATGMGIVAYWFLRKR
jgi:hypothetical protein